MNLFDPRITIVENILMRASHEQGGRLYAGSLFDVHQLAIEILKSIEPKPPEVIEPWI